MRKIKKNKLIISLFVGICMSLFVAYGFSIQRNTTYAKESNIIINDDVLTIHIIRDIEQLDRHYEKENRQFAAMSTVESTGKRLWSAWMSGGNMEPHNDNYIIVAYSDDLGDSWYDPFIIIDDLSSGRTRDPVLWYAPTGELYLFFGCSKGTSLIKINNPEGNVEEITLTKMIRPFSGTVLNKPIVTSDGEWLLSADPFISEKAYAVENIIVSTDQGKSWEIRGEIKSRADCKKWHESTIIQKKDGVLWVLSRIEQGKGNGVEQAFSTDNGGTWTDFEANLDKPLIGPGSKCVVKRLKDGGILFVSNNSTTKREKMTAYYSNDEGLTWKSLLLDGRKEDSAYPDIAQDQNGNIYVVWDYSRSQKCEIRLARFSLDDINEGMFVSEKSSKPCITKNNSYVDIVSVNTEYSRNIKITKGSGVSKEEVISMLPSGIEIVLDNGQKKEVIGTWDTNWFSSDYIGEYEFVFTPISFSEKVDDINNYFSAIIKVTEKKEEVLPNDEGQMSGCSSYIMPINGIFLLSILCSCIMLKKRSK